MVLKITKNAANAANATREQHIDGVNICAVDPRWAVSELTYFYLRDSIMARILKPDIWGCEKMIPHETFQIDNKTKNKK